MRTRFHLENNQLTRRQSGSTAAPEQVVEQARADHLQSLHKIQVQSRRTAAKKVPFQMKRVASQRSPGREVKPRLLQMPLGAQPTLGQMELGLTRPRNSVDVAPMHTAPDLATSELHPAAEGEEDGRRFPKRKVIKNKY